MYREHLTAVCVCVCVCVYVDAWCFGGLLERKTSPRYKAVMTRCGNTASETTRPNKH